MLVLQMLTWPSFWSSWNHIRKRKAKKPAHHPLSDCAGCQGSQGARTAGERAQQMGVLGTDVTGTICNSRPKLEMLQSQGNEWKKEVADLCPPYVSLLINSLSPVIITITL